MTVQTKVAALRSALNERHYERYDEIEIALAALVSRYHALWLGPPGTGKSMLSNDLTEAIVGARLFVYLLDKFTTPEEIHGPMNVERLKHGSYERIIEGKLPDAHIAFVDEWFKANSAIQNANLTIMNERKFDNGKSRIDVPLLTLFAASNELPEGEELNALFDRFHFRKVVNYIIEPDNFINMLKAPEQVELPQITLDELAQAHDEVVAMPVPEGVYTTMYSIRSDLQMDGIVVSDRRFKQAIRALQAIAYMDEAPEVGDDHFRIMEHMMWAQPQEIKRVARVIRKHTNPLEIKVQEIMDIVEDIQGKLHGALMDCKQKNVDPKQALVKQGVEWFGQCQKLGKKVNALEDEALKTSRPLNRVKDARNRVVKLMRDIGENTIDLDSIDGIS